MKPVAIHLGRLLLVVSCLLIGVPKAADAWTPFGFQGVDGCGPRKAETAALGGYMAGFQGKPATRPS